MTNYPMNIDDMETIFLNCGNVIIKLFYRDRLTLIHSFLDKNNVLPFMYKLPEGFNRINWNFVTYRKMTNNNIEYEIMTDKNGIVKYDMFSYLLNSDHGFFMSYKEYLKLKMYTIS